MKQFYLTLRKIYLKKIQNLLLQTNADNVPSTSELIKIYVFYYIYVYFHAARTHTHTHILLQKQVEYNWYI